MHICDNHITIYLPFPHFIESNNNHIQQFKNNDIAITTLGALGRLNHTK